MVMSRGQDEYSPPDKWPPPTARTTLDASPSNNSPLTPPSFTPPCLSASIPTFNAGTVDALFGEWISEEAGEMPWLEVMPLLFSLTQACLYDECRYHGNKSGDSER